MLEELFETQPTDVDYNDMMDLSYPVDNPSSVGETQIYRTTELPGFEGQEVIVSGNPEEFAEQLDWSQGDNSYNALGCCGLVSIANMLQMCGIDATEEQIVKYAVENGLCEYSLFSSPEDNGGTYDFQKVKLLEDFGVDSTCYTSDTYEGSIEGIADAVENGHAVSISINAGLAWDDITAYGDGSINHQVTVTGTVRDANGQLIGLTICDSGRHLESDACRTLSLDELNDCYTNSFGSAAIITDDAIR